MAFWKSIYPVTEQTCMSNGALPFSFDINGECFSRLPNGTEIHPRVLQAFKPKLFSDFHEVTPFQAPRNTVILWCAKRRSFKFKESMSFISHYVSGTTLNNQAGLGLNNSAHCLLCSARWWVLIPRFNLQKMLSRQSARAETGVVWLRETVSRGLFLFYNCFFFFCESSLPLWKSPWGNCYFCLKS